MLVRRKTVLTLAACLGCTALGPAALAADAPVQLKLSPDIADKIVAFPRLVAAADDKAAQRINKALDKRDASARQMQKDCLANVDQPNDADYERTIWVTMQGPRYLGFLVSDNADCGGAHPSNSQMALVYDLVSGAPVKLATAPAQRGDGQGTSTDTVVDGTTVGFVTSKTLQGLWLKAEAAANPIDPDCEDLQTIQSCSSALSDAKAGGPAVQPGNFAHVIAACADTNVIPTATLRPLGIDAGAARCNRRRAYRRFLR